MSKHWESATFFAILLSGLSADSSILASVLLGCVAVACFAMSRIMRDYEKYQKAHAESNGSAQANEYELNRIDRSCS